MLVKRQTLSLLLPFLFSLTLYANDTNTTDILSEQNLSFSTTYWKLVDINEHLISPDPMKREAHIVFSVLEEGQGKFKGATGCNEMLGKYSGKENTLNIDTKHIAMTRMACPDMALETDFIRLLGKTAFWKINAGYLSFKDSNGSVIMLLKAIEKAKNKK